MISDYAIQESGEKLHDSMTVADVLAVVATFNGDLGTEGVTASFIERIKEWMEKLVAKLKDLVDQHQAQSFSITVGLNVSVAVTIAPMIESASVRPLSM